MVDGVLPFTGLTGLEKELEKKVASKSKQPTDHEGNLISLDLLKTKYQKQEIKEQSFALKEIVFCKSRNLYVQLKKFDLEKQSYLCRLIQKEQKE